MIWVIEMENGGVFEAATKRELVDQMAKHYAENNCEAGQIKAIFMIREGWTPDEATPKMVSRVQALVEEALANYLQIMSEQFQEQENLRNDYWAGVL